jgi:hypothetical protein
MKKYLIITSIVLTVLLNMSICFSQEPSDELTQKALKFIDLLNTGNYTDGYSMFASDVKKEFSRDDLTKIWKSLLENAGPLKKQIKIRKEKGTFKGKEYEGVFVTCEFEKTKLDIEVVFNELKEVAGLHMLPIETVEFKIPAYAKPDIFKEKEVIVGTGEFALHGTLTMPAGTGPFPAVILVHGSGPNDRDETVGGNKPFRDIAWGLASNGIAVLRYEKRTKEHGKEIQSIKDKLTVKEETIDDAILAVDLLKKTEGIDKKKILVLGHSLGGMLIPRIGKIGSDIAGFIVLAGATRPLEDMTLEQVEYILSLKDKISEEEKLELEKMKKQIAQIKDPALSEKTPSSELLWNIPPHYWLDLRGYNPPEVAKDLTQPMLILQGERDYQVTMVDFNNWKKYLGDRKNVEFKSYPKLNHLFIEGEGKCSPEEYMIPGNIPEYVIKDMADWIKK